MFAMDDKDFEKFLEQLGDNEELKIFAKENHAAGKKLDEMMHQWRLEGCKTEEDFKRVKEWEDFLRKIDKGEIK